MAYRSELTSEVLDGLTILRAVGIDTPTRLGQEEVWQLGESLIQPAMSMARKDLVRNATRRLPASGGLNSQRNFQAAHQESSVITLDERG